jgi:PIN domain nuclease of toxin-antitoxin system
MRVLLDTCTFLWIAGGSPDLSETAKRAFQNPENDIYLSVISSWEIVVKYKAKKLPLPKAPDELVPELREKYEVDSLPLEETATLYLKRLPDFHRDPFDRMLICQAIAHELTILTPDRQVTQYPVRTLW